LESAGLTDDVGPCNKIQNKEQTMSSKTPTKPAPAPQATKPQPGKAPQPVAPAKKK
jgi:hypothetical protein